MSLRQLKAVQIMKRIILDNSLVVMSTTARCACAYEALTHQDDLEDLSKALDTVLEQCVRVCELSRYLGGDIDQTSIAAHSLGWHKSPEKIGDHSRSYPTAHKHSQIISGTWYVDVSPGDRAAYLVGHRKYASGAVGSFTYVVALQGRTFSSEFEVFADGYRFRLLNPCVESILYIRRPGMDVDEQLTFSDEDAEPSLPESLEHAEDRRDSDLSASAVLPGNDDASDVARNSLMQAIQAASERERKAVVHA